MSITIINISPEQANKLLLFEESHFLDLKKSGNTILNYSPCSIFDLVSAFEEACLMSSADKTGCF
jgi:hypothetical protein